MKKYISFLLVIVLMFSLLSGCGTKLPNQEPSIEEEPSVQEPSLEIDMTDIPQTGFNDFDHSLICFLQKSGLDRKSFSVSPLSFKAALCLLLEGADGESEQQLLKALGFQDKKEAEDWYATVQENVDIFEEQSRTFEDPDSIAYKVVNSVWKNSSIPGSFTQEYLDAVESVFGSVAYEKPANQLTEAVNQWASDETNGMISEIVDDISDVSVVLANALYLKTNWYDEMSEIGERDFTDIDGNVVQKQFLMQQDMFQYYEDDNTQIVILPLEGGISMAFVIGDNTDISDKLQHTEIKTVHLEVPEIDLETSFSNSEFVYYLQSVGCDKIFNPNNNDFKHMFTTGLYVDDIIQKTKVKTDKYGLEAAAVTAITVKATSAEPGPEEIIEFIADKPFTFYVFNGDNTSPELLFYGQIMQ